MKKVLLLFFLIFFIVGTYAQSTVSGDVTYANTLMSYLDSVTVYLKQGTTVVSQTTTDGYGHFEFTGVSDGTYELTATTSKAWGGCNSSDATAILKHFVGITTLGGVKKKAANLDNITLVNTADALMAARRFANIIDSFPAGDWVFEHKTITVAGGTIHQSLKGCCIGDVNASFSPPAEFVCGQTFTDSRDDKTYSTVLIGQQCWMAQNMNIGTFIFGVGDQTNNYVMEKFCYHNEEINCDVYGGLYQWGEMMQYDTNSGVQGICPGGFHIPSNAEWDTLIMGLGGYSVAGNALRADGTSGFNALLGGWVFNCQKFRQLGVQAYFWSSDQYYDLYAYSRIINWNNGAITNTYENKNDGLSVRCIKD